MSPAERIAAYHAMPAPRNLAEHITAAALLGLPLDERGSDGTTLHQRLAAYWQGAVSTAPKRRLLTPGLDRWQDEMSRRLGGDPARWTTWVLDDLWRAACWERSAQQAAELGFHASAQRDLERAREIAATGEPVPVEGRSRLRTEPPRPMTARESRRVIERKAPPMPFRDRHAEA